MSIKIMGRKRLIRILGVSVISGLVMAVAAITAPDTQGNPDVSGARPCSIHTIAGAWVFATDVGHLDGVGDASVNLAFRR